MVSLNFLGHSGMRLNVVSRLLLSLFVGLLSFSSQASLARTQDALMDEDGVDRVVVYKKERRMELHSNGKVLRTYRVSLGDNPVGHKLYEGDKRTPEGDYVLDWRKHDSNFYKAIHISYPNDEDRAKAAAWGQSPGGRIMIHGLPNGADDWAFAYIGLDWTNGCIAVSNEEMDEIWSLVEDGTPISIHP